MYANLSVYDIPVLLGLGFKYGFSGATLWGTSVTGNEYRVIEDGEWLRFAPVYPDGKVGIDDRMTHVAFNKMFRR